MDLPSLFDGAYANAGAFLSLKGASIDFGDLADGKSNAYYLEAIPYIVVQNMKWIWMLLSSISSR